MQDHVCKCAVGAGKRIFWIKIDGLLKRLDGPSIVVWTIAP
jgi:hypothetical protein